MIRRPNLVICLPLTLTALLFYLMTAFTVNADEFESSWKAHGAILGPARPALHSSDLKIFTQYKQTNVTKNIHEVKIRPNRMIHPYHSRDNSKENNNGTKPNISEYHKPMVSKPKKLPLEVGVEVNDYVKIESSQPIIARHISADTKNEPYVISLLRRSTRDSSDGNLNREFNFSRPESGPNIKLPRTLYTGISSFRSRHYVKYPSPFPEDNTMQSYSGSGHSGQSQNLQNAPTNYTHSSVFQLGKTQDALGFGTNEAPSRDFGSHSNLFDLGGYGMPENNDYSFAASQMESGSQSSLGSEFPGLMGAPPIQYSSLSGPSFVPGVKEDFTAVAGTTAILSCRIRNLHNYTVSWVRGRDIRLLTTGLITYTSDKRFVPSNPGRGPDWLLKIHYSRKQDAGAYLCQVSLSPPITKTVNLQVHEAVVTVHPGKEVHVQVGSTLRIECRVQGCFQPVPSWTHGGYPLPPGEIVESTEEELSVNGSSSEVEITSSTDQASAKSSADDATTVIAGEGVGTERSTEEQKKRERRSDNGQWGDTSINLRPNGSSQRIERDHHGLKSADHKKDFSSLTPTLNDSMSESAALQLPALLGSTFSSFFGASTTQLPPVISVVTVIRRGVTPQHSGIYTCTSTCTPPINVTVHVLRGEELAAIHHQNAAPAPASSAMSFIAAIVVICFTSTFFDEYLLKHATIGVMCIGRKSSSEVEMHQSVIGNRSHVRPVNRRSGSRKQLYYGKMSSIVLISSHVNFITPKRRSYEVKQFFDSVNNNDPDIKKYTIIHPTSLVHLNNNMLHACDLTSLMSIVVLYYKRGNKTTHLTNGNRLRYNQLLLTIWETSEINTVYILLALPFSSELLTSRLKIEIIHICEPIRNEIKEDGQINQFQSKSGTNIIYKDIQCFCYCPILLACFSKRFMQCPLKHELNKIITIHLFTLLKFSLPLYKNGCELAIPFRHIY